MPIDYRRNLSTNKCPQSMEMRLRDPKCRNEMKDRPHKNPHDEPKPTPPKPDPPDPKPKPPRPDPKPQPNPKPDFNAPRPIPYHTSSSMPVSATGMAIGGASAGLLYGAYNSSNIANLTRGYRQLGEVKATPAEPVEDIQFAEPAETEMADITPRAPEGLRTTSLDEDFFQQGESLEAGAEVGEEAGTVARTAPEGLRTTSLDADFFRASGDIDFQPSFKDFSSGFEETQAGELGETATGEGLATIGEEGGIEMADLGATALATGGAEVGAEIGAELGASATVAGGEASTGIGAILAPATLAVGLGVAVGQLIGGAIQSHQDYVANEFNNIEGTQKLSTTQLQSMITTLNKKQLEAKNQKQINAIQKQIDQLTSVKDSGQQAVVYTDSKGNQQIAFTLSNADLGRAIKTYQSNPNAFKGLNPTQLEIMGLNPSMSKGKSGAKGFDKNGVYTPKGSYDTKNIANNYLASNRQGDITGQKGIDAGFSKAIEPQAKKAYEKQFEDAISNASSSADKTALRLQYNAWRASQGMDTYGDQQKIHKLNEELEQGKITQNEYDTQIQPLMEIVKTNQKEAPVKYQQYLAQQRQLQEEAEEQEMEQEQAQQLQQQKIEDAQKVLADAKQASQNLSNQQATFTASQSAYATQTQTFMSGAVSKIQQNIDNLNSRLATIQQQANTYTSQGKKVPSGLTDAMNTINTLIKSSQANQARIQQQSIQTQQRLQQQTTQVQNRLQQAQAKINTAQAQAQSVIDNSATTGNQTQSAPKPATTNT